MLIKTRPSKRNPRSAGRGPHGKGEGAGAAGQRNAERDGGGAMKKHVCNWECDHFRTPLEEELSLKVKDVLSKVPAGSRATIEGVPWIDVRVVCSGETPITVYYCCLKPGHEGQCYSSNKNVYFTPERR